jgi:hypothetical protein
LFTQFDLTRNEIAARKRNRIEMPIARQYSENANNSTFGRMPAANERFGATAGGSADLKGSAKIPPLRQAAIPLGASVMTAWWTKPQKFGH